MPAIRWLPWTAQSFSRAHGEAKPVLLSIAASWCGPCADMDRTSYAHPDVVECITRRFVAIRVDADRRPDISHRYSLGGYPTTAFLTPDGDIMGGGTYVVAERLVEILDGVSRAFADGRHVHPEGSHHPYLSAGEELSSDELTARVEQLFDARHGGFGDSPKFPHVAPVRLALERFKETGSQDARAMAMTCLDAMGWGPLYDEGRGGFFRYSEGADWGRPHREKLLDVNASLLRLYVDAYEVLGLARYAERAADILRYVHTWLADRVDGGWAASQQADADDGAPADPASADAAPPVDHTLFADWNGLMISAALRAGEVMHDAALSEFAIASLEHVGLRCYRPGKGMAHYVDREVVLRRGPEHATEVRGLLDDQIAMAQAHLDAFEATGNIVYEMMAEELMLYATRTLWDEEEGGFRDHLVDEHDDIGLLREPYKPFVANCSAARVLHRLASTSGNDAFATQAARTLAAVARRASAEGPLAAEFVLAAKALAER
jgi:uncharacterized protein YyaL (SSP411 family)